VKLALYHPWIYVTGGIERSLLHIITRSRHDWTLYTHHYDSASTFPGPRAGGDPDRPQPVAAA
jgi:hypothetical protein